MKRFVSITECLQCTCPLSFNANRRDIARYVIDLFFLKHLCNDKKQIGLSSRRGVQQFSSYLAVKKSNFNSSPKCFAIIVLSDAALHGK